LADLRLVTTLSVKDYKLEIAYAQGKTPYPFRSTGTGSERGNTAELDNKLRALLSVLLLSSESKPLQGFGVILWRQQQLETRKK